MSPPTVYKPFSYKFFSLLIIMEILHPVSSSTSYLDAPKKSVDSESATLLKWKVSLQNQTQYLLRTWRVETTPCQWVGIHCDTGGRVSYLNLSHSGIRGTLEDLNVSLLPNLRSLDLFNNSIYGTIPSNIGNLSKLSYLDLSENHLSGTIPPELGLLRNAKTFYLDHNNISGSIPQEICFLKHVIDLSLSSNILTGTIPTCIGNMSNLSSLFLYQNQISGTIPSSITNLTKLSWLNLYVNQLSGPIPREIGMLSSLQILRLYTNKLSGTIPSTINNCTKLANLHLGDNQLSGRIPSELGSLKFLSDLLLFMNNFSGSVPKEFDNLTHLTNLSLSVNHLTEVILGEHLGDFMSSIFTPPSQFAPSTSTSSISAVHDIFLKDVLDQRLLSPTRNVAEEVVGVALLALACINPTPQLRPTIQQVSVQLSKEKAAFRNLLPLITIGQLLNHEFSSAQ
ncbi:unnamed protein product [Fraxinus pennsylvanica]|uniref:non-specific serine/threonine protein kinase n=1 Tax=Fraxinus pennsylvanica TaxID=56036 RepID=A0AAD2DLL0_9LAMI|nr:unnamed protein product [Fraxinus pennsylvanica]